MEKTQSVDLRKLLQKYYAKMVIEALLKSAIYGFMIGFGVASVTAIISWATNSNALLLCILLGIFVALLSGGLLFGLKLRPSIKTAAARVDALGLDERVITMLEFAGSDSYIANIQRNDACQTLTKVTPKHMKFNILRTPLIALGVMAVMATSMVTMSTLNAIAYENIQYKVSYYTQDAAGRSVLLTEVRVPKGGTLTQPVAPTPREGLILYGWYRERNFANEWKFGLDTVNRDNFKLYARWLTQDEIDEIDEQKEIDDEIQKMIEALREIIDTAEISDGLREQLHQIVDRLEENLLPEDSTMVKIAKILETRQEILDLIAAEQAEIWDIVKALMSRESTYSLGEGIGTLDPERIEAVFKEYYNLLITVTGDDRVEILNGIADDIEDSLEESEYTEEQMGIALQELADALRQIIEGDFPSDEELEDMLEEIMEDFLEAISDMLEDAQNESQAQDDMLEIIDETLESIGMPAPPEDDEEDGESEEGEETGDQHAYDPNTDLISKVIDGQTPYTDVFEEYYQLALEALSGDISDELREMIMNYLRMLEAQMVANQ